MPGRLSFYSCTPPAFTQLSLKHSDSMLKPHQKQYYVEGNNNDRGRTNDTLDLNDNIARRKRQASTHASSFNRTSLTSSPCSVDTTAPLAPPPGAQKQPYRRY